MKISTGRGRGPELVTFRERIVNQCMAYSREPRGPWKGHPPALGLGEPAPAAWAGPGLQGWGIAEPAPRSASEGRLCNEKGLSVTGECGKGSLQASNLAPRTSEKGDWRVEHHVLDKEQF